MEKYKICNVSQLDYARSLSKKEKDEVEKTSSLIHIEKGDVVFLENEKLQNLYCIQDGICKFYTMDEKGKEHITKLLGEGELMGRRSIINDEGAAVSARAITDVTLFKIHKKPFLQSLKKNSSFCLDVLKGFMRDVKVEEEIKKTFYGQKGIKRKLASLLCYLSDKYGVEKNGSLRAKLRRADMAGIIGTSSEYVINILKYFKQRNLIVMEGRAIQIVSKKKLRSFAIN
ncbi:Crp/Fnr family transcriptional regulator [Maribacter sp. 2304DJ31-5]|uniref:Crp/Fnr family transcriptional regulator n=1 Tax=Maribacter sp. 2304DJ31-5 TaxID=3386273 RepID=UPI0039BC81AC